MNRMPFCAIQGIFLVVICLLASCRVASPELKELLYAKDLLYQENLLLMDRYSALLKVSTSRVDAWKTHIRIHQTLNLALEWATRNPQAQDFSQEELVEIDSSILGKEIVEVVNEIRLKGLPARRGPTGEVIFVEGGNSLDRLLRALPRLLTRIEDYTEQEQPLVPLSESHRFSDFWSQIIIMRRINSIVGGGLVK